MTQTAPPTIPGSRRVLPTVPSKHQVERVQNLLHQGEHWVRRGDWKRYLDADDTRGTIPIELLGRDQRVAAAAWISQQRHVLHELLDGQRTAPEGWLEALPLYRALTTDDG